MRTLLSICLVILALGSTSATASTQIPDEIVIEDEKLPLLSLPLSASGVDEHLDRSAFPSKKGYCTAAWRGYMATWTLRENKLYLLAVSFEPCRRIETESVTTENATKLFFGQPPPIPATWYSGTLVVGKGAPVAPGSFVPEYANYLVFEVQAGAVLGVKEVKRQTKGPQ
jgi:hypothetical protein